jgi:hypothetical protein
LAENTSYISDHIIQENTEEKRNAIVNDNAVRIRDQPTLEGKIIVQLNQGMSVTVLGRSQERMFLEGYDSYWLRIKKDDIEGWVYGAYIDLLDTQYESLLVLSTNESSSYFTKEFLERAIKDPKLSYGNIIFDSLKTQGLLIYYGGRLSYGSNILERHIGYGNYNIILVTEEIGSVEYVRDYLILEKQNPETYLGNGPVEINGAYFDWEIIVVVNHRWHALFTDDISQAFKVNLQTKKIEQVTYNSIRLYAEE